MGRTRSLIKKAIADFELARRYKDTKESVTASLLYSRATEKVLRAMFITKRHRTPPKSASISYLANKVELPNYISETIVSPGSAGIDGMDEIDEKYPQMYERQSPVQARIRKRDALKRLIDYARATMKT